jgi:sporulation protein YlmC with PRC-barrel domain
MKKHLFMTLLAMIMFFPSVGAFAQEKASPRRDVITSKTKESQRIRAFRAKDIIGYRVINLEGQQIGAITNLVIDIDSGSIVYAALDFGGFLGFRDKLFAVPWQSLAAVPTEGLFILEQTKVTLQKAPGFDKNNWPDIGDKQWRGGIYQFYKRQVPSHQPYAAYRRHPVEERYREYYPYYSDYVTARYPGFG